MGVKITVIGGASSYTPELFADLIDFHDQLDVAQVTLMDPNEEKLSLIREVCSRVVGGSTIRTEIKATSDLSDAVKDSDFVILQVRVGGTQARIRDETIPMELGMVGNETTGAGGFVCALRTVPVVLEIAREIERLAPHAWVLNLSNPAGIVTEALLKHSGLRAVGFCNIPINTTYELARVLDVPPEKVRLDSFGLNHLSWTRAAYVDGQEMLQPLISATTERDSVLYRHGLVEDMLGPEWLRTLGMIPSWYLRYYYYTEQVLEDDLRLGETDGSKDVQAERKLRSLYLKEGFGDAARHILTSKGGAQYYLPVLQVISSIEHDSGEIVVVDVRNEGALPDLPPNVCVEVPARIRRAGIEPLPAGNMLLSVRGLVQSVKAYEELTVEAATTGRHEAALAALATHPLVGSIPKARAFWERVLQNERPYLLRFFDPGQAWSSTHDSERQSNGAHQ
jgi:6-phospho-beta-glucosidase